MARDGVLKVYSQRKRPHEEYTGGDVEGSSGVGSASASVEGGTDGGGDKRSDEIGSEERGSIASEAMATGVEEIVPGGSDAEVGEGGRAPIIDTQDSVMNNKGLNAAVDNEMVINRDELGGEVDPSGVPVSGVVDGLGDDEGLVDGRDLGDAGDVDVVKEVARSDCDNWAEVGTNDEVVRFKEMVIDDRIREVSGSDGGAEMVGGSEPTDDIATTWDEVHPEGDVEERRSSELGGREIDRNFGFQSLE